MSRSGWWAGVVTVLLALAAFTTLRGSKEKMERQNAVARENHFVFAQTPDDIARLVAAGQLVALPGSPNYTTKGVSFAYARPQILGFVERLGTEYRATCAGQPLVITSLVRPISLQPRNASPLSVHPAGMAVDLHVPDVPACRAWLTKRLLDLAAANVLDVTEEKHPHQLHVAVFPRAYAVWLKQQPPLPDEPQATTSPVAAQGKAAPPLPPDPGYREELLVVLGTAIGMLILGAAIGVPLRLLSRRSRRRWTTAEPAAPPGEDVNARAA